MRTFHNAAILRQIRFELRACSHAARRFLKVIGRQPVIIWPDKLFVKEPGATRQPAKVVVDHVPAPTRFNALVGLWLGIDLPHVVAFPGVRFDLGFTTRGC